jgi:hypothetical protein
MARKDNLESPAAIIDKAKEKAVLTEDIKKLDISNLDISDFRSVKKTQARFIHPFDGYPLHPKMKIGESKGKDVMISGTFLVGLKPTEEPPQDISGENVTIIDSKTKHERIVTLKTVHSRVIQDWDAGGQNLDIVFDRKVILKHGVEVSFAVVHSHSVRAQLCYFYHVKSKSIRVDPRYTFLDMDQVQRLLRLFRMIVNPRLKRERMAAEVSGEVESSDESLTQIPSNV